MKKLHDNGVFDYNIFLLTCEIGRLRETLVTIGAPEWTNKENGEEMAYQLPDLSSASVYRKKIDLPIRSLSRMRSQVRLQRTRPGICLPTETT